MSTYTDLQHKLKETLNVDYNNRISLQHVRLLNDLNEFKGTFCGKISSETITTTGLKALNTHLYSSLIEGCTLLSCQLKDASGRILDFAELQENMYSLSDGLCVVLPEADRQLGIRIDNLCMLMQDIATYSDDISTALTAEAQIRKKRDTELDDRITAEYNKLSAADRSISVKLDACINQLSGQSGILENLSNDIISSTETRKHYAFTDISRRDSAFYAVEYAQNKVACTFPNFFIKINNTELSDTIIGQAYDCRYLDIAGAGDGRRLTAFTFEVFEDIRFEFLKAGGRYEFKKGGETQFTTGKYGEYLLTWDKPGEGEHIELIVSPKEIKYYEVSCESQKVGEIHSYLCADGYLSGVLDLVKNENPRLSVFNGFPFRFSNGLSSYDFESPADHWNKYVYNSDQRTFTLKKDYSALRYHALADAGAEFGRIISNHVRYSEDAGRSTEFEGIDVNLSAVIPAPGAGGLVFGEYTLNKANGFAVPLNDNFDYLELYREGGLLNDRIQVRHRKEYFQYALSSHDMTRGVQIGYAGQIQIPVANITDISDKRIMTLSVVFEEITDYVELNGVYRLDRQVSEGEYTNTFKCVKKINENVAIVTYENYFDQTFVYLTYKSHDLVKRQFYVDSKNMTVRDGSESTVLLRSGPVRSQSGFVEFNSVDYGKTETFGLVFDKDRPVVESPSPSGSQHYVTYVLNESSAAKRIRVNVPENAHVGKGRQFDICLDLENLGESERAWVEFTHAPAFDCPYRFYCNGKDVTGDTPDPDKRFYITRKTTNLRFTEYEKNAFIIQDLANTGIQDRILSNDTAISCLSADLSALSGLYGGTFSDIGSLPNKLLIRDEAKPDEIYQLTVCHGMLSIKKYD